MRINQVVAVTGVIGLTLWVLFNYVLTPRERLTTGETSVLVLIAFGVAIGIERLTRPEERRQPKRKKSKKGTR